MTATEATPGARVRLTEAAVNHLRSRGCGEHAAEFGCCVGVVLPERPWAGVEDTVDVRWEPSGLRYAYGVEMLEAASSEGQEK